MLKIMFHDTIDVFVRLGATAAFSGLLFLSCRYIYGMDFDWFLPSVGQLALLFFALLVVGMARNICFWIKDLNEIRQPH